METVEAVTAVVTVAEAAEAMDAVEAAADRENRGDAGGGGGALVEAGAVATRVAIESSEKVAIESSCPSSCTRAGGKVATVTGCCSGGGGGSGGRAVGGDLSTATAAGAYSTKASSAAFSSAMVHTAAARGGGRGGGAAVLDLAEEADDVSADAAGSSTTAMATGTGGGGPAPSFSPMPSSPSPFPPPRGGGGGRAAACRLFPSRFSWSPPPLDVLPSREARGRFRRRGRSGVPGTRTRSRSARDDVGRGTEKAIPPHGEDIVAYLPTRLLAKIGFSSRAIPSLLTT